jgi:hypothetical protein
VKSREGQRICFSDAAAPQLSLLFTLPERAFEGILFSAICSALRFYTAKTQSGPPPEGRRHLGARNQTLFRHAIWLARAPLPFDTPAVCETSTRS